MKITQRLEDGVRAVARAAGSLGADLAPDGPAAVYARILDGEHLWLAVPEEAGTPGLWDLAAGALVDATDDLPPEHREHEDSVRSARLLLAAVPEEDAEVLLVAVPDGGGRPAPLRPPPPAPASNLRVPCTADGEWRFALEPDDDGFLRVRRTRADRVVRLLDVALVGAAVSLRCTAPQDADDVQLVFLAKGGAVAASVPMDREAGAASCTVAAADLPEAPGTYRVAVGGATGPWPVVRRVDDLLVEEPTSVLMPLVLDPVTEQVAGRLGWTAQGALRLVRKPVDRDEETA